MKNAALFLCAILASLPAITQVSTNQGFSIPVGNTAAPQTVKVMVVFAEVDGACTSAGAGTYWPEHMLPLDAESYFNGDGSNWAQITTYFDLASFGSLNLYGDYLDHIVTVPCANATGSDRGTDYVLNHLDGLINSNSIDFHYGSNLSEFDQWEVIGLPDYRGATKPNTPNGKIDVLLILWRNNPVWIGCYCGEGLAPRETTTPIGTFSGCDNKAAFGIKASGESAREFVIQEYFHAMFGGNNWHLGAGAGRHTFPFSSHPHGIASQPGGSHSIIFSGWDRQHLGWYGWLDDQRTIHKSQLISAIDPITNAEVGTDLTMPTTPNVQEFWLRDFVATGDAIRIQLPYINWNADGDVKNQYLWLENHQKWHPLDIGTHVHHGCEDWEAGLLAYLQVGKDITSGTVNDVYPAETVSSQHKPNALASYLLPLSAEGNWDYNYRDDLKHVGPPTACVWGAHTVPIDYNGSQPNPFLGMRERYNYYNDDQNGTLHDPTDVFQPGFSEIVNGQIEYNAHNGGDAEDSFTTVPGRNLFSMATNPAPVPTYTFTSGPNGEQNGNTQQPNLSYENRTIWLNGLKIEIVDSRVNNEFSSGYLDRYDLKIRVEWDQYEVDHNVRWCGNIKLSPNAYSTNEPSLNLSPNKTITLDRSQSYDRHIAVEQLNGQWLFSAPTKFTCLPHALFHMEENSELVIKNKSEVTLQPDSKLEVHDGAVVRVQAGSKLIIKDGAQLALHDGGLVHVEAGATLVLESNAVDAIHLGNPLFAATNAELRIEGTLEIADNVDLHAYGDGFVHILNGGTINFGANSHLKLDGEGKTTKMLELGNGVTLWLPAVDTELKNGLVQLGAGATLETYDADVSFFNTTVIGGSPAMHGQQLTDFDAQNTDFAGFESALDIENFTTTAFFANCTFTGGSGTAIVADELAHTTLIDCHFEANDQHLDYIDCASVSALGTTFKGSNYIGVKLKDVGSFELNGGKVYNSGTVGIYATRTEVYLRDGAEVFNNGIGVTLMGSPTLNDAMLTVGDIGCASIRSNGVGISGQDFVLDIDAEFHAQANGTGVVKPNRFEWNFPVFDITYTNPGTAPLSIPAKGNIFDIDAQGNGISTLTVSQANVNLVQGNSYTPVPLVFTQDIAALGTGSCKLGSNIACGVCSYNADMAPGATGSTGTSASGADYLSCISKVRLSLSETIEAKYDNERLAYTDVTSQTQRDAFADLSDMDLYKNTNGEWEACHPEDATHCNRYGGQVINQKCAHLLLVSKVLKDGAPAKQYQQATSVRPNATMYLYPNPTSTSFTVTFSEAPETTLLLTITNVFGQQVYSTRIATQRMDISHDFATAGLYLVEVTNPTTGTRKTQPLLVQ